MFSRAVRKKKETCFKGYRIALQNDDRIKFNFIPWYYTVYSDRIDFFSFFVKIIRIMLLK